MIRVILILLSILSLYGWLGYRTYMSYVYEDDIVIIVKDVADRQQQIDELNATVQEYEGYKFANEALLQHCNPSDVVKAIKATPLPKRG